MIAGLVAQGYRPGDSCRLGVYLHGYIADVLAEEIGEIGLAATDLVARIPLAVKEMMVSNGIAR